MSPTTSTTSVRSKRTLRQKLLLAGIWSAVAVLLVLACTAWIGYKATSIKSDLQNATALLPTLKDQIQDNDAEAAQRSVDSLVQLTGSARDSANDPLWKAASTLPWIGPNLQAANEVATSADDVARLGAAPLISAFQSLNWQRLTPGADGMDLAPLQSAAPKVQAAARAVSESAQRLDEINTNELLPQVSGPLIDAREQLSSLEQNLNTAADAAWLAPNMLGADGPRRYLLLMQNNAESRATGGIPGALAVLNVDRGKLSLESQTSATALGAFLPPVAIDSEQSSIYTARVGKFMQDVNLTPDFATSASTAQAMWEKSSGERLDGVLSLDPVALSFILDATGPVEITDPAVQQIGKDLPVQLTGKNVVKTLLSDAYAKIDKPELQDVYFAGAAKEIFAGLSSEGADSKRLLEALQKGVEERRILIWSADADEQKAIARYSLSGMISGPAISPAQFGVYFNDGTGAKMDFWVKRTVQVAKDCTRDGYREITVRVTSTNTAPADAATSLPAYVTGGGIFGVPAGTVQTNVVAYGPVQANIDTVVKDGVKTPFAAQRHSQRGVATSTISLAPGESTTLEFNFGHIVQHAQPEIAVTPTTQPVNEVIQAPIMAPCE